MIATADVNFLKENRQGRSKVGLIGGTRTIKLDRMLYVWKIAHHLMSIFCRCDDGHTVLFTKYYCVIKMQNLSSESANVRMLRMQKSLKRLLRSNTDHSGKISPHAGYVAAQACSRWLSHNLVYEKRRFSRYSYGKRSAWTNWSRCVEGTMKSTSMPS